MSDKTLSTADLIDINPHTPSCETQMKMYGLKKCFYGPIRTIRCKNDNGLIKTLLNTPSNGGVLVVDGSNSMASALMGDIIAEAGMKNGWAGVVIFGPIRDSETINTMNFGVKALGTNPKKSAKNSVGEIDAPFEMGGVEFVPGYWLYSDSDGILVTKEPFDI